MRCQYLLAEKKFERGIGSREKDLSFANLDLSFEIEKKSYLLDVK